MNVFYCRYSRDPCYRNSPKGDNKREGKRELALYCQNIINHRFTDNSNVFIYTQAADLFWNPFLSLYIAVQTPKLPNSPNRETTSHSRTVTHSSLPNDQPPVRSSNPSHNTRQYGPDMAEGLGGLFQYEIDLPTLSRGIQRALGEKRGESKSGEEEEAAG
jgi:hypothetical protein